MYCKHCGKEIADDSKFCQYCGGKIDDIISPSQDKILKENLEGKTTNDNNSKNSSTNKWLKWGVIYAIYVVLNILLLVSGNDSPISNEYFWPFGDSHSMFHQPFDPTNYDFTDFLVYVFLIPLCVFGWMKFISSPEDKNKEEK